MIDGEYSIKRTDSGFIIRSHHTGRSFILQGDDYTKFKSEWIEWQEDRGDEPFSQFLAEHEYDHLFQCNIKINRLPKGLTVGYRNLPLAD